jgi:Flp/Fap pilin component
MAREQECKQMTLIEKLGSRHMGRPALGRRARTPAARPATAARQRAQAWTPYGIIAAGVSLAVIAAVKGIGTKLNTAFSSISTQFRLIVIGDTPRPIERLLTAVVLAPNEESQWITLA